MTREALVQQIEHLLDPSSDEVQQVSQRVGTVPEQLRKRMREEYLAEHLAPSLAHLANFPSGEQRLLSRGDGASGFGPTEAGLYVFRSIAAGLSPSEAVGQLEDLISLPSASGLFVLALWGVAVAATIQLNEHTSIVRFQDLPQSRAKDWINIAASNTDFTPLVPWFYRSNPPCAIVLSRRIEPLFVPSAGLLPRDQPLQFEIADAIRLSLTLIGPSAPLAAAAWFQFDDAIVESAQMYGGIQTTHIEIVPAGFVQPTVLDPELAPPTVAAFLSCRTGFRSRVRISLERLNAAIRRRTIGDKALELAISFESLLTDGGGENTFKVGLRAAHLYDGNLESKRRVRSIVEALYSVRSAVVHDGHAPSEVKVRGVGRLSTTTVISEALQAQAAIVRKLLLHGDLPNWQLIDLGGGLDA